MKAKAIAKKLKDDDYSNESIKWMISDFDQETLRLIEARNIKTDDAMLGIIKDQKNKWGAISKHTGGAIKKDAFWDALNIYAGTEVKEFAKNRLNEK